MTTILQGAKMHANDLSHACSRDGAVQLCMFCVFVCAVYTPVDWLKVFLQPKLPNSDKKFTTHQVLKNANGFYPNATTMMNLSASFSVTLHRIHPVLGSTTSRRFHHLRTVVLFFDELVDFDGWVCNFVESLPDAGRCNRLCFLFS